MAETELNIVLRLVDEATAGLKRSTDDMKKQFGSVSQSLDEFGKKAKSLGKEISQVGSTLAFVGAGITGPFVLALNKAANESVVLKTKLETVNYVGQQLANTVATSLLPIIDKFSNGLSYLLNWFNSLEPALRDMVIQTTFLAGVFLSVGGIISLLVGKVIGLIANLASLAGVFIAFAAANLPLLAIIASIATLLILMTKFKDVADVVMSTFQVLFLFLKNGFLAMKAGFELALVGMLESLQKFSDLVSKLPSALGFAFKALGLDIKNTSQALKTVANEDLQAIITNANEVGNILSTGTGSWAQNFDNVKQQVISLVESIKNIGLTTQQISNQQIFEAQRVTQEQINLLNFYKDNYMKAHAGMAAFTQTVGQAIQTNLSSAITSVVTGTKTAKEAFTDLGKAMIETIVNFMAQKLVASILEKTLLAGTVASAIAAGAAVAAAWAPAALFANVASFGGAGAAAAASFGVAAGAAVAAGATSSLGAVPKFHDGGMIRAHDGLAVDEVPIIAQTGEGILSRKGMNALGGSSNLNRLNSGQSTGAGAGNIEINVYYPKFNNKDDMDKLMRDISFNIQKELRYAR